uniref:HAT C-terminal dimerisation domain-containing protein n=1 Tax=Panagrolaimus davidi TaxID=227884 RepID=A0A914Q5I3_9BILA
MIDQALITGPVCYYEDDDINDFEVLNVKSLEVINGAINFPQNSHQNHENLAKRFQINSPNIGLQFENLLQNVATAVTYETFQQWIKLPPEIFYAKILETAESDDIIDLSDELFDYLSSALTVPVGSADAERGFSILFHSLDSRRSHLNISTIDNILQIRLNGPPIDQFVCFKFVEDWKKAGHLQSAAQQPRGIGRKTKNIIESDDPIENFKKHVETQKRWERRYEIFVPDPFN